MITPALLASATGCSPPYADLYAPHLAEACQHHAINTPQRLAAFLAQIGHESGGLRYVREIASGDAYESRADLGNIHPGDGQRYRGRGLIQITGRANYARMARLLAQFGAPNFEAEPEALEQTKWACWSAAAFWAAAGCNTLADKGSFEAITRAINGGLNGLEDRKQRWERAKQALATYTPTAPEKAPSGPPVEPQAPSDEPKGTTMAPFLAAALPSLIEMIPKLGRLFAGGSDVAERNVAAAQVVAEAVQKATGAANIQTAVELIKEDPEALKAATQAVEARWIDITEAGGGGIDGARKADAAAQQPGVRPWQSPSMWAFLALAPLVYMIVGSVVGLWGTAQWSDEVRASLATAIISLVIGGAAGYYWGATTSRNRPAP